MEYVLPGAVEKKKLNDILMGTAIILGDCGITQNQEDASASYRVGKYNIEVKPICETSEQTLISKIEIKCEQNDGVVEKEIAATLELAYRELISQK